MTKTRQQQQEKQQESSSVSDYQYQLNIRVYYEDTDVAGIVYNANFLRFFERARSEWLRELGINQADILDTGVGFVVRRVEMDNLLPAKFNELLSVHCKIRQMRRASMIFDQYITNGDGKTICTGLFTIACVDLAKMKPVQFPANISEVLKVAN